MSQPHFLKLGLSVMLFILGTTLIVGSSYDAIPFTRIKTKQGRRFAACFFGLLFLGQSIIWIISYM